MLFLKALWLLLPAGFANMAPVFAAKVFPRWSTSVDFGRTWKGTEIFGSHKTYRGLISGTVLGFFTFWVQQVLYAKFSFFSELSFFNYLEVSPYFGAWMGFAALLGDLIKSFFKRRASVAPGKSWIPLDQIDWVVGALLSVCVVFNPNLALVIASIFVGVALHFVIKYFGFVFKLNPTRF